MKCFVIPTAAALAVALLLLPDGSAWAQADAPAAPETQTPAAADWQNEYTGDEPGTLALYNFSEGVERKNSAASGGYNLALKPKATTGAKGKFGLGLDVERTTSGDEGFAQAQGSGDLFPEGDDPSLTVELWVRFDTLDETQQLLDKQYTQKGGYQLVLYPNQTLRFTVGDGETSMLVSAAAAGKLKAGQWHHVAGTWDAADDTLRLYVDGKRVAQRKYPDKRIANSGGNYLVRMGNRLGSSYYSLDGQIDGVRISSVAHRFEAP